MAIITRYKAGFVAHPVLAYFLYRPTYLMVDISVFNHTVFLSFTSYQCRITQLSSHYCAINE